MRTAPPAVLLALLLTGSVDVRAAADSGSELESFEYQWSLGGFKGFVARVFIPGRGEGRLTTVGGPGGSLVTELLISSREGKRDDYWLYGAEIDPAERRTVRAWSAQRFRGESKRKERRAGEVAALDLASSIHYLREELPLQAEEAEIWASGRLNPVVIEPTGRGLATLKGEPVATRAYAIRGVSKKGRPKWRGEMELVLTDDDKAVPLEIVVTRNGMRIRLELIDG